MAKSQKNSLVNNINKKKKAGTSRPKSKSKVSKKSYGDMKSGWSKSSKSSKKTAKKSAKKASKKSTRKKASR